jgi:hypothetical protein
VCALEGTVDRLIWHCETEKRCLTDALAALEVQLGTTVRDYCVLIRSCSAEEVLSGFPRKSWN